MALLNATILSFLGSLSYWLTIGFDPEVVEILNLLPYLKDGLNYGEPPEIAHDAPSLSYLGKGRPDYRGGSIPEIPVFLGAKDFFITGNSKFMFGGYNTYYVYKSKNGMFISMEMNV